MLYFEAAIDIQNITFKFAIEQFEKLAGVKKNRFSKLER